MKLQTEFNHHSTSAGHILALRNVARMFTRVHIDADDMFAYTFKRINTVRLCFRYATRLDMFLSLIVYVLMWLYRVLKFNREIVRPMVIPSSPFSAVALLFCGGFSGIGLTGWYRLTAVRPDPTVEPATSCGECVCERTSTGGPSARLDISFFSVKGEGFLFGLLTGLVIACFACCVAQIYTRKFRRAAGALSGLGGKPDTDSSVAIPVNQHGDTRATTTSPRRSRRGGGKLEVASARASDSGLVR